MSHTMGVMCPQCRTQTVPESPCPERCGIQHGSTYILCDACAAITEAQEGET